ncbi:MAG: N-6 DNA methylase [Sulfurimonas sp.]|nr:N-6 DNA methylase [Sulfurimonas sp.]
MNKQIKDYIKNFSNDLHMVNKLIVAAYLKYNDIEVKNNKHILALLSGNDYREIDNFIKLLQEHSLEFNFEDVINLFEITIPTGDIVVNGAIYTPRYIREYIVTNTIVQQKKDSSSLIVADIACGSGAFLYSASKSLKEKTDKSLSELYKNNIFGLDISDYALERTRILLTLFAIVEGEDKKTFEFNLFCDNSLDFDWYKKVKNFNGFDIVIGNPPYVRTKNLDVKTKKLMKNWQTASSGNADLYIPFFEIGYEFLKEKGSLGYITANTFKKSVNARALRSFFEGRAVDIIDFGHVKVFEGKMTYTCITFLQKINRDSVYYTKLLPSTLSLHQNIKFSDIKYSMLNNHKGWLLAEKEILKNIHIIEKTGIPLGDKFLIKNGLATLQNTLFIFMPKRENKLYYFMEYNDKEYKIEKEICRDVIKPNKLKTEDAILSLTEKIIFPYVVKKKIVTALKEVVFKEKYPKAYSYLLMNKELLMQRDKGKEKKYEWFEFGRSQSINDYGIKLLFPYMSNKPYFVYSRQENLLFYAGYAIYGDSERELRVVEKILKSKVFWYYIEHTSKPYSSKYYALAKNYVKDFGICNLTSEEEDFLLKASEDDVNDFLCTKYSLIF